MLKSVGFNLILALITVSIASEGVYATPIPRFSMPKWGRPSSKPDGPPPRTTNDAGEPISFMDFDSVLDMPVAKAPSDTAAKAAKGSVIGGTAAAIIGGGAAAGYVADSQAGEADLGAN